MGYRIFVGSYTDVIYTLSFDPEGPSLTIDSSLTVGHHPSWLTPHPKDRSIIYTGLEQTDGRIVVVKYDRNGKGTVVGEVPSGGADPCTLLAFQNTLAVVNYSSGVVVNTPLSLDTPYLTPSASVAIAFTGSGPNKERQEASHPHQMVLHPDRQELLIPDLGCDKTRRLARDENGKWISKGEVLYKAGSGPRHIAFYKDVMYTVLELTNEIAAHRLPPLPAEPTFITSIMTMKSFPPPPESLLMLAAEILIPKPNASFSVPYLYVSNRNDPSPAGDVISIYSIANPEKIEPISEVRTGLKHLRGMLFGGPDDKFLAAGGAHGGGVKIFERIDDGKGLREITQVDVEAPTGFLWV